MQYLPPTWKKADSFVRFLSLSKRTFKRNTFTIAFMLMYLSFPTRARSLHTAKNSPPPSGTGVYFHHVPYTREDDATKAMSLRVLPTCGQLKRLPFFRAWFTFRSEFLSRCWRTTQLLTICCILNACLCLLLFFCVAYWPDWNCICNVNFIELLIGSFIWNCTCAFFLLTLSVLWSNFNHDAPFEPWDWVGFFSSKMPLV